MHRANFFSKISFSNYKYWLVEEEEVEKYIFKKVASMAILSIKVILLVIISLVLNDNEVQGRRRLSRTKDNIFDKPIIKSIQVIFLLCVHKKMGIRDEIFCR